jgi:hypothetical protein
MANVINATSTGNGGLITTGDDSGVLNIQTNETTAATIDASQNVSFTNGVNMPNTFGFKNRIINGGMVVNQYAPGASVISTAASTVRPLDRFFVDNNGSGTVTCAQSTTAPAGFSNSLSLTVVSTDTPASGDYLLLSQIIEGYNIADLNWGTANAKTVTVSFWVRSSVTGTYGGSIRGGTSFYSYVFTYTVNAANTWEQKTITVPGTALTSFNTTTSQGFQVMLDLGSGTGQDGTANTWQAGSKWRTSACVNWISNSGATFLTTGWQVEVGTQATSFDFRSYGTELDLCQRYCEAYRADSSTNYAYFSIGQVQTSIDTRQTFNFKTQKRALPTLSASAGSTFILDAAPTSVVVSTLVLDRVTLNGGTITASPSSSTMSAQQCVRMIQNNTSTCFIIFIAEL